MPKRKPLPTPDVPTICAELQRLGRLRVAALTMRNMPLFRLKATVASSLGYCAALEEKDRKAKFVEAEAVIKRVLAGGEAEGLTSLIRVAHECVAGLEREKNHIEKAMEKLAAQLPAAAWAQAPEQKAFGVGYLAKVIAETGDLSNYADPAKVWRRMGCAPWQFNGETKMGSTWRREGKLPASEWSEYGYSPRRRSIAYLIGESLLKGNVMAGAEGQGELPVDSEASIAGPYRARYYVARAAFAANHPDYSKLRCHLHGLLLAAKLALRNLWVAWRRTTGQSDELLFATE